MPKETTDLLIRAARRDFDQSKRLAMFASKVLRESRDRVAASLVSMAPGSLDEPVSVTMQKQILDEINRHLSAAERSLRDRFRQEWTEVYQLQFTDFLQEVAAFERTMPSGITAEAIDRFLRLRAPVSSNVLAATLDGSLNLLSETASHLREPIRKIMAVNIIEGGSYSSIIRDITKTGISKGPFATVEHRARAIAITETTNIYNTARYESLHAVNRTLPANNKIDLQWLALIDGKTSARCRSLHRQVRKQGRQFHAADGWKGTKPAAHPHCRSQVVPYRREWEQIFTDLDAALKRRT